MKAWGGRTALPRRPAISAQAGPRRMSGSKQYARAGSKMGDASGFARRRSHERWPVLVPGLVCNVLRFGGWHDRQRETTLRCNRYRLGARVDAKFIEDRSQMLVDSAGRDEQSLPNGLARESLSY